MTQKIHLTKNEAASERISGQVHGDREGQQGTPIITVKPNAATPARAEGAAAVRESKKVNISNAIRTAKIVWSEPRKLTGRPELTEVAIVVSGVSRAALDSGRYPHSSR